MITNYETIIKLQSGIYTGVDENGKEVVVTREVGSGFTVKTLNSKGVYECEDYSENGDVESSYIEY